MSDFMPIDRRSMLERALLLIGATAATSFSPAALAKAAAAPRPSLAPADFALLSAVADTIIPKTETPGALDARVPAKLDALLVNWATPEHRAAITGALIAIDRMARDKEARGFAELPPEKRKELLVPYDIAALKPVPRREALTGMEAMMAGPSVADAGYGKLKELIVVLYYYSEEALTTELTYEHSPGGWTPSIKVIPETRATGGLGMF